VAAGPKFSNVLDENGVAAELHKVVVLFLTMQPWLAVGHFSIKASSFVRALLLTSKLLGAAMLASLFFDASGQAASADSPDFCAPGDTLEAIKSGIYVAIASALLSSVPLFVMQLMQRRTFKYNATWDKDTKQCQLNWWRLQDMLQVIVAFAYCTFCVLFVACFLANIKPSVEEKWFYSFVFTLLREFLLVPLGLAVAYVAALKIFARRDTQGNLKEAVQVEVGHKSSKSVDEAESGPPTTVEAIEDRPDTVRGYTVVSPDASRRDEAAEADGSECGPLREIAVAVDPPSTPTVVVVDPPHAPTYVSIDPPLTLPNEPLPANRVSSSGSSIPYAMHPALALPKAP